MPDIILKTGEDQVLVIRGSSSFLIAGQAGSRFPLCIETCREEYCQTLEPHCLVAVSAPGGGSLKAAWMLLELVRTHHVPLMVMPSGHPGSRRLKYVVSAGEEILLSCSIERGTHPEQHLLCSSPELGGIRLSGTQKGIRVSDIPEGVRYETVSADILRE